MSTLAPHLDLSVVVPAYNERARIAPTLEKLSSFLSCRSSRDLAGATPRRHPTSLRSAGTPASAAPLGREPLTFEIIVVDDGSSDGTAEHVESLAIPHTRVVRSRPNRGKGAAVRTGMLEARGLVRVMCDADGSMPAEELPKLLAPIASGEADIAIGSRYVSGAQAQTTQPLYRRLWSRLCNRVIQKSLVPGIRDTQCGFKAFTAIAAEDLFSRARIDGWAFDLEILALARRRRHPIAEVGVAWTDDKRSRVNPLEDLVKVVREALAIRRNLRRGVYGTLAAA